MVTVVKKGAGRPAAEAKRQKHAQRNVVVGGNRTTQLKEAAAMPATPKPKFTMIGKGKFVHVVYTKAYDLKHSGCQAVRKAVVADRINYKHKGLSPEAALALDGCDNCGTAEVAKRLMPAESKAAAAKDKRDEVLERTKVTDRKGKRGHKTPVGPDRSDRPSGGGSRRKEVTKAQPSKTKAGFRSIGADGYEDKTQGKAVELAAFATEHGWEPKVHEDKPGWCMTATKNGQTVHCWFVDGKYDITRQAQIIVGSWTGTLRGAHAVRRQMTTELDNRDRPHPNPGKGRTGPRAKKDEAAVETESPEDAAKRVPFSIDDDDIVIIDMLLGKTIRWRNTLSNTIEEAVVPSGRGKGKRPLVTIKAHPKNGRRILDFLEVIENGKDGEVVGPERNVALDKIVRVL